MFGKHVWALLFSLALLAGCPAPQLDSSQIGAVTASEDVKINDVPHRWSWNIPAEDVRSVFAHLEPRDAKFRRVMLTSSHDGTVTYRDEAYPLTWARVKIADKIYLIDIDGYEYMLTGEPADSFHKLLADYRETVEIAGGEPS